MKNAGARHVVCCSTEVGDTDATRFAHYLYHALVNGRCLKEAFEIAVATAKNLGDVAQYSLLSDGNLWLHPTLAVRPLASDVLARALRLPPRVEDFVGRQLEINAVVHHLSTRQVVIVHSSASGVGLTAALTEMAHFLGAPGRMFSDRVSFCPERLSGGLLVCDDADDLLLGRGPYAQLAWSHLQMDGGCLLLGCHGPPPTCPFGSAVKAVQVPLGRIPDAQLAFLYLRRVHRPLTVGDLLAEAGIQVGSEANTRVLQMEEAVPLVAQHIGVFGGHPAKVCQAADFVTPGSPCLRGNLKSVGSEPAVGLRAGPGQHTLPQHACTNSATRENGS